MVSCLRGLGCGAIGGCGGFVAGMIDDELLGCRQLSACVVKEKRSETYL